VDVVGTPQDIFDGNVPIIVDLLWTLVMRYQVLTKKWDVNKDAVVTRTGTYIVVHTNTY